MCGINFIINKTSHKIDLCHIENMNHDISHRGPDYQHFLEIKNDCQLLLGHVRLEILDCTEASHQPFVSPNNRYFLIFNGEIYNYQLLKKQLINEGVQFRSTGDTEVLLHWLIYKGKEGISELEGMFAFVFYDQKTQQTIIARDQSGIKPVFYYEDEKYLIVSSEIKGIQASKLVNERLNITQIHSYLLYKFPEKGETFFEGIKELDNGKVLFLEKGEIKSEKSFVKNIIKKEFTDEDLLCQVEELLIKSVEKHLQADVPIGLFLSGGVDSTLLLAILKELGYQKFPTFSITHQAKEESFGTQDYLFTQKAVKQYGSVHQQLKFDSSILNKLDDFIEGINQPIGDGAFFLTHLLSEFASQSVKVVWSGSGADEYFGGYNRHAAYQLYLNNFYQKNWKIKTIKQMGALLPTGFSHPFRKKFRLYQKFSHQIDKNSVQTFLNFTKLNISKKIFSKNIQEDLASKTVNTFSLDQALLYDKNHFLISDILNLSDQTTMTYGLEMRVPFLDTNLINFISQISSSHLLKHGKKWILKHLLNKRNGEVYSNRIKEGFGVPFGEWIRQDIGCITFIENHSLNIYQYIDYEEVQKLVYAHMRYKMDYTSELWSIILLAKWLEFRNL